MNTGSEASIYHADFNRPAVGDVETHRWVEKYEDFYESL